ncbi:MAG: hypothetical protein M0R03_03465 [Novosphingobium sp.]|nr:hypothetical protein [Novosphingobium sp.]
MSEYKYRQGKIYTVDGITGTLKEIKEKKNLKISTQALGIRIKKGKPIDGKYKAFGIVGTIEEIIKKKKLEISPSTVRCRLWKGISIEKAFILEKYKSKYKIDNIKYKSIREIAKRRGISYSTLCKRLQKGMPLDMAVKGEYKYEIKGTQYKSLKDIGKAYNIPQNTISQRLKKGMSLEEAVTTPRKKIVKKSKTKKYFYKGKYKSIAEHTREYSNLTPSNIRYRMKKGMSLEEALEIPRLRERKKQLKKIEFYDHYKYNGSFLPKKYLIKNYALVSSWLVNYRLSKGWDITWALRYKGSEIPKGAKIVSFDDTSLDTPPLQTYFDTKEGLLNLTEVIKKYGKSPMSTILDKMKRNRYRRFVMKYTFEEAILGKSDKSIKRIHKKQVKLVIEQNKKWKEDVPKSLEFKKEGTNDENIY